jgi:hypothetical protein
MVEGVDYQVVKRFRDIEIRQYPEMVIAEVIGLPELEAFSLLFRYIGGRNRTSSSIPMTAPVISGDRIPMTRPVVSRGDMMAFVLPSELTIDDAPEPLDERVRLVAIAPRRIAALRFSGHTGNAKVEKMTASLLSALKDLGVGTVGRPFLMRYNSPATPGFMRRNEVAIGVDEKA